MKKLFLLVMCAALLTGCGGKELSNEEMGKIDQEMMSGKFFEEQTLDNNIIIKDFNIVVEDGNSSVSFNVENKSVDAVNINNIKVNMYDENSLLVQTTYGYIGGVIEGSSTKFISMDVDINLSNVESVSFERA